MIDVELTKIKIKGDNLVVISGLVIEEKLMEIPLTVVPFVKFQKDVKSLVINALINKNKLDVVIAMQGKTEKPTEEQVAGWSKDK